MYEEQIEHLLSKKKEIDEVSPWARVKLRVIKDDLEPLINKGVPIKHLIKILAPLEITKRKDTLRKFILEEFPAAYAKYYAKQKKAQLIKDELGIDESVVAKSKDGAENVKNSSVTSVESQETKPTAKKLDPYEIANRIAIFKGKPEEKP